MPRRLAVSLALLAFAICLIAGVQAGNPTTTVLSRALTAMVGTLAISLIVGTMLQRMLEENLARREKELREQAHHAGTTDVSAGGETAVPGKAPGRR